MCLYNTKRKRESIVVCSNQIQDNQHTIWPVGFRTNVGSKLLNNCLKAVSFSYFTERILSSVSSHECLILHSQLRTIRTPVHPDFLGIQTHVFPFSNEACLSQCILFRLIRVPRYPDGLSRSLQCPDWPELTVHQNVFFLSLVELSFF